MFIQVYTFIFARSIFGHFDNELIYLGFGFMVANWHIICSTSIESIESVVFHCCLQIAMSYVSLIVILDVITILIVYDFDYNDFETFLNVRLNNGNKESGTFFHMK